MKPAAKPYKRGDRLESLLHREVGMLLLREVKNPELTHLNVSRVEVSRDGKKAFIYFTSLNDALGQMTDEDRLELEKKLRQATPALFFSLRKQLQMKYVPGLEFRYDLQWNEVSRIWGLAAKAAREVSRES